MTTIVAHAYSFNDADVTALLSLAMSTTSKHRKAAALMLANAMRKATVVHEALGRIAEEAGSRYGDEAAAEVRAIASELRLN